MKLYKYKSLNNLSHLSELLSNQVIHCSLLNKLNDPWEGKFINLCSKDSVSNGITFSYEAIEMKSIYEYLNNSNLRIASFSSDCKNRLLWSYYADSYKGVCVEIDIPDNLVRLRYPKINHINKVKYKGFYHHWGYRLNEKLHLVNFDPETNDFLKIVTNKAKDWKHESEFRLVTNQEKYNIQGMITKVYLGDRIDDKLVITIKQMVQKIPVKLLRICNEWNEDRILTTWKEEDI